MATKYKKIKLGKGYAFFTNKEYAKFKKLSKKRRKR